ncbi:hypothetical protein ACHHYP_16003 [Achlya hypogyna]|uniref:N-acetyltransferase domain-containing protein n=1 Tax=Achlya hypogyna TaxID=1202772 RepID=A0A1V9ZEF6_ACHHY|nr:hypothetical protein ACHHYP_16003 [Achlya hypogyna]
MTVTTAYTPEWFYMLEESEASLRAGSVKRIPHIGTLYLSPQYPLWDLGNCLFLNTDDPATLELPRSVLVDAAQEALIALNAIFDGQPRAPFFLMSGDSGISHAVKERWVDVLGELGYGVDEPEESHCLTLHRSQLPQLQAMASRWEPARVRRATTADFDDVLATEPGDEDALGWRTEKVRNMLQRPVDVSAVYVIYDETKRPVSRFYAVKCVDPSVAYIARVNTLDDARRKGHAQGVLVRGLLDLFEAWPNLMEVALLENEPGPEKLYESFGMVKRGSRYDNEFTKRSP